MSPAEIRYRRAINSHAEWPKPLILILLQNANAARAPPIRHGSFPYRFVIESIIASGDSTAPLLPYALYAIIVRTMPPAFDFRKRYSIFTDII